MLAVAHAARGRGVGEALVRACAERARAVEGRVRVVLSTQRTMRTAHRLYERLGFVRTPERDWNPLPELDDITLLTYALTLR
jgi:ribosomal protein S18 acetylase RimI-like enzyme